MASTCSGEPTKYGWNYTIVKTYDLNEAMMEVERASRPRPSLLRLKASYFFSISNSTNFDTAGLEAR